MCSRASAATSSRGRCRRCGRNWSPRSSAHCRKDLRRNFVPAPDTARAVLADIDPAGEPLLQALQRELRRRTGVLVPIDAFDLDKLPPHLRVTFSVESADGTEVARGKDLTALQERLATTARAAVADAVAGELERTGLRGWPDDLEELPQRRRADSGRTLGAGLPGFRRRRRGRGVADVRDVSRAGPCDATGHATLAAAERGVTGQSG